MTKTATIAKHTPGPWVINAADSLVMAGQDLLLDPARVSTDRTGYDEALANIRLISAAPEMLAALEGLLETDDTPAVNCSCHLSPPCDDCVSYAGRREALAFARAAIAKAEGK